jgi:hypothetical protein
LLAVFGAENNLVAMVIQQEPFQTRDSRIDWGPVYRVHYAMVERRRVLLLAGHGTDTVATVGSDSNHTS